jgi:tetratricopeptide (TPR) repeat protein
MGDSAIEDAKAKASEALDEWLTLNNADSRQAWFDATTSLLRRLGEAELSDTEFAEYVLWIASGYLQHFHTYGFGPTLDLAIDLVGRTMTGVDEGHVAAEGNLLLTSALHERFRLRGSPQDLVSARVHGELALSQRRPETADWADAAGNLAVVILDKYRERHAPEDLARALELFNAAEKFIDDPEARFLNRANRAGAYHVKFDDRGGDVHDLERAIADYRTALDSGTASDASRSRVTRQLAKTLTKKALAMSDSTSLDEATTLLTGLLHAARSPKELVKCRIALAEATLAAYTLKRDAKILDEGVTALTGVLVEHEDVMKADVVSHADVLRLLGDLFLRQHHDRGRYADLEQAISVLRRALDLLDARHHPGPILNRLANAVLARYTHAHSSADLDWAIDLYRRACDESGSPTLSAIHLNNLGNALLLQHRATHDRRTLDEAIASYRRSLALPLPPEDRSRHLANLAAALRRCVVQYKEFERLDEAIALLDEARALVPERAVDHLLRSAALARVVGDRWELQRRAVDRDRLASLVDAIRIPKNQPLLRQGIGTAHFAVALLRLGRSVEEHMEAAEFLRENFVRLWINRESSDASAQLGFQEQLHEVSVLLVEALLAHAGAVPEAPAKGRVAAMCEAMMVVEASKSMILSDQLAMSDLPTPDNAPAALITRERQLIDELRAADRLATLGQQPTDIAPIPEQDARIERLQTRVFARAHLYSVWDEMEALGGASAEYAAFRRGVPMHWDRLTHIAGADHDDDVAFVSLHRAFGRLGLFVARAGWSYPRIIHREIDDTELEILRRRFLREVPGDPWGTRRLTWHEPLVALFEQARSSIENARTVVLSLPGEFWSLPFSLVFRLTGWSGGSHSVPMVVLPTLAMVGRFRSVAPRPAREILVVGNPTLDLEHAEDEATAIASHFGTKPVMRANATRDVVLGRIETARLLHIAAHGSHRAGDPLGSGLELYDGVLTAREILSRRLSADLVVLSACESGLLAEITGEELLGLGQTFLLAGARAVVMSLWRVDDRSTTDMMRVFYNSYAATHRPAWALARAMDEIRDQRGREAPYYWAPFVMMGDWHPPADREVHVPCAC